FSFLVPQSRTTAGRRALRRRAPRALQRLRRDRLPPGRRRGDVLDVPFPHRRGAPQTTAASPNILTTTTTHAPGAESPPSALGIEPAAGDKTGQAKTPRE